MDQVATRIQNTLLNNRVKILRLCDYFTVSAPLISKRILPIEKHKEIKSQAQNIQDAKAANTARMDSLLDFIDEVPSTVAFDTFLEGVKNCEASKQFAKILKKEVEGGNGGIKLVPKNASRPKASLAKRAGATTSGIIADSGQIQLHSITGTTATTPAKQNTIFGGAERGAVGDVKPIPNGPSSTALPISFSFANIAPYSASNHTQMLQTLGTEVSGLIKKEVGSGSGAGASVSGPPKKKTAAKKVKSKTAENGPSALSSDSGVDSDVFTFNPNANPPAPLPKPRGSRALKRSTGAATPRKSLATMAARKSEPPVATPSESKEPSAIGKKQKKPVIKRVYPAKVKAKPTPKVVTPGPSLTATLVYKNKDTAVAGPSTPKPTGGAGAEVKVEGSKVFSTSVPTGSPFRPKNGMSKSQQHVKPMTFQEAEEKQKTSLRSTGFTFLNSQAVVKKINYSNKSDLFYEGCPTKEGNYLCTKKVQLKGKGKKYICKQKHENEVYELFPRLFVTFEDTTGQMETTVYRENAEILSGKSMTEMHSMNDEALSTQFSKAIGINIPIRVSAEKILKKDLKTSGGKTWNNIAHILSDNSTSGPPPSKKAKKAAD